MTAGTVLNTVARCGRWIALLSCVFLLASVLDNIPDCPELLNQKLAVATSIHFDGHLDFAAFPLRQFTKHTALVQPLVARQLIADLFIPIPLSCIVGSLCLATNTSPPLV
jgi:hypothetical protein